MKLVIGGCRGAHPVVQQGFFNYGGDTTSFHVQGAHGDNLLIDVGTGVRVLGAGLQAEKGSKKLLVLMTHYHLDHILGLPSLGLLHDPSWHVTFAAPTLKGHRVGSVLPRLLKAPFWPLQVEDLAAKIDFKTLEGSTSKRAISWGKLRIRWCPVHHPGGCTAYRIEEDGHALVVATDVEWALSTPAQRKALHALCAEPTPADLLVMDGQYDTRSYPGHENWGHSTWQECVALAQAAGVGRLVITHHGPSDDDGLLDRKAAAIQAAWGQADLARSNDTYTLLPPPKPGKPAKSPAKPKTT
jgi:phosphoribosyl 1,2-cyclic phosphodiesterase